VRARTVTLNSRHTVEGCSVAMLPRAVALAALHVAYDARVLVSLT